MNITITVPVGTSNHGDPNLLCTPAKWYEVLLFYAVNYLAHAVTVKALPGEQLGDTIAVIFAALIYPYSGVLRGIEAIARHAAFSSGNALQKAARAGALCSSCFLTKYLSFSMGDPEVGGVSRAYKWIAYVLVSQLKQLPAPEFPPKKTTF